MQEGLFQETCFKNDVERLYCGEIELTDQLNPAGGMQRCGCSELPTVCC